MKWEEKPLFNKDEIVDVTPEMVNHIKQKEQAADAERLAASRRKINFERRKASKETGTPYISIEEEERQNFEKEERQKIERLQKKQQPKAPEIWNVLQAYKLSVVGKIDPVDFEKKPHSAEENTLSEMIDPLYRQAQLILGNEEIDEAYVETLIQDFEDLYSIDEIEADIKRVIDKEARITQSNSLELARLKKLATILEAVLVEGVSKYDWLGKKIKILPPSKFDELCHGVDAILELGLDEEANEFLALGIDVSYRSVDGELFEQKIKHLLDGIDRHELTQIKYFKDNQGNPIEDMYVPKVVVSVDGKTTHDLAMLWSKRKIPAGEEELKRHTIAYDVIGQIAEQCKLFSAYAKECGADSIAAAYDETFDQLLKISEEVPKTRDAITYFSNSKFVDKIAELTHKRKAAA